MTMKICQGSSGPQMPPAVFAELMEIEKNNDFEKSRYMELLGEHHYPLPRPLRNVSRRMAGRSNIV